ncbi:MAG: lipid A deacylase LpxR family protein [Rickettsiales bacterium]
MFHYRKLVFVATLFCSSIPAIAQERSYEDDKAIFSLVWENDKFAHSDRDYTNGVRLSWLSAEETTPYWVRSLAHTVLPMASDGKQRISMSIGQNMYTPTDLTQSALIPNDRPYAGWTYGTVGIVSDTGNRLDTAQLTIGIVGPSSGTEATQKFIHRLTDSQKPMGWDNQLKDEPGIVFTMERKWRSIAEFEPFGAGVDVTPYAGFNLGNINTDASVGATVRLGYDLPADYGPPRINPSLPGSDFFLPAQQIGGYLFAGVEGRAVGRNIFLDGNSFQNSHSVDKNYFVGSAQVGAALTYENTRLSYTHIFMTDEFKQQKDSAQFGALTLSYRF